MKQKKLVDMNRDELLEVVWDLINALARKINHDLQPNRSANVRHQYHKRVWGRKKLAMIGLLHKAVQHCPKELAADIQAVLDHEEDHYQRRDAAVERLRMASKQRSA